MSDKEIKLGDVTRRDRENTRQIELAKNNAGISEAKVLNYQKRIEQLKIEYDLHLADLQKQLDRAMENAKYHRNLIDTLIQKKEDLHKEFKSTMHYGEVQCEYCKLYFKNMNVLDRHQRSCTSKPEIKIVEDHAQEIRDLKDELVTPRYEVPVEKIIEEKKDMVQEIKKMQNGWTSETQELEWLYRAHQDWIDQYAEEEGARAIWQGRITNGFRTFCEEKGYKLVGD